MKNLMSLDKSFANSTDIDTTAYDGTRQPPGTVHSVPGRNIRPDTIDRMLAEPNRHWLLHGHWGELMPLRHQLCHHTHKWLLLTIDSPQDRQLVSTRHQRLGQDLHPYWLDEEQLYLYQPQMYQLYFGAQEKNIFQLSLAEFWHPNLQHHNVIQRINDFFAINIDPDYAQQLHKKWWLLNFSMSFCTAVRDFYKVDIQ